MAIEQIISPQFNTPPLRDITTREKRWFELVTELDILTGTGSPEGVVEAKQKRLYMDENTAATPFFYIKQRADIGGDRTQGWRAIA